MSSNEGAKNGIVRQAKAKIKVKLIAVKETGLISLKHAPETMT